jgi:uracil-DNA glycosylase
MNVEEFQEQLCRDYNRDIGLPSPYYFLDGSPVEPVVPLDVAVGGIVILGAYPTAGFAHFRGETQVPVKNIERPLDPSTKSGQELKDHYLNPLGIEREQCWVTNLVKTFLFKPGHVEKYRRLGIAELPPPTRDAFETYAASTGNLAWLQTELELAQPKVVITLGAEVAGILRGVKGRQRRNKLLTGTVEDLVIGDRSYHCIHFAHPGIIMRGGQARNPWPRLHQTHILTAYEALARLL